MDVNKAWVNTQAVVNVPQVCLAGRVFCSRSRSEQVERVERVEQLMSKSVRRVLL